MRDLVKCLGGVDERLNLAPQILGGLVENLGGLVERFKDAVERFGGLVKDFGYAVEGFSYFSRKPFFELEASLDKKNPTNCPLFLQAFPDFLSLIYSCVSF